MAATKNIYMKKKQKIYVCGICDNDFTSPQGISAHVRNKHTAAFKAGEIDNKGRLLTGWKKIEGVPPYVKGSSSLSPETIAAMRTEKDWLDCIDNVLVNSGIVPTCTAEKPNGMDRLESIEHLIKLVKEAQKPAPAEAVNSAIPWSRKIVLEFEGACKGSAIMMEASGNLSDPKGGITTDQWNGTIEKTLTEKRNKLIRIIDILFQRATFAEQYERELMQ
jgi:hypothetical protein